jgi:hypothetical protein
LAGSTGSVRRPARPVWLIPSRARIRGNRPSGRRQTERRGCP